MAADVRVALIADIHGNLPALEAVLDDLESDQPDQIICLGDVGAMGPFPVETLERIRALRCPVILGNGDATMLEAPEHPEDETARKFADMDHWCAEQLTTAHREFIETFRQTLRVNLPGGNSLLCFHGSPRSYNDVISATTPDEDLDRFLDSQQATIMAGGHWHFQMLRRFKDTTLFNPGSVGLPYEFDASGNAFIPPRSDYGLVTISQTRLRLEHRRVEYDSSITTRAMHERGFPHAEWWSGNWRS